MSTLAESLNLRPQEKRIIVVIAVVVFLVLNIVLVFPRFKEYGIMHAQLDKALADIAKAQRLIDYDNRPGDGLIHQLEQLQDSKGGPVLSKEIMLQQTITDDARASGVFLQSISSPSSVKIGPENLADKFFESQSIQIVVQAGEESLVKFLFNIGNDPAMIRVKTLNLRPVDNNRYKLNADITLTADYQKTVAAKKTAPVLTEAPVKTPAKAPANTPPAPAARSASTNVNPAPTGRGQVPPAPGGTVAPPSPSVPGRLVTPPGTGQSNVPPRNLRTAN